MSDFEYIEPEELKARIEQHDDSFHIVDVRDYDYGSGYIKTPSSSQYHHIPIDDFTTKAGLELARSIIGVVSSSDEKDSAVSPREHDVIFHCFYSQQRGPSAALIMLEAIEGDEILSSALNLKVLRGGWGKWNARFYKNEAFVVPLPSSDEESTSSDEDDE